MNVVLWFESQKHLVADSLMGMEANASSLEVENNLVFTKAANCRCGNVVLTPTGYAI